MNEDLFSIINDIVNNNDIELDDLYDNQLFEDIKMLVLEIYAQFTSITTNDEIKNVEESINNLLYMRQHMPLDPQYSNSELLFLEAKIKYLETIPQPEQRTDEWYVFRNNRLTASDFYSVIDNGSISRRNELIKKKCGVEIPFLTNDAILHGVKFEQLAVEIYEKRNKVKVLDFGCLPHPVVPFFGASPDGIVSYTSDNKNYVGRMLEIKCPKSRKITGIIPNGYYAQVQGQLEVCDLEYCDFLECDFQKYKSKEEFFSDNEDPFKEKGIIIELYDNKLKKTLYHYSEDKHVKCIKDFEAWSSTIIDSIFEEGNEHLEYLTSVYWYLNKLNVVLVKRDKSYFSKYYENIKKFWDEVLHYRNIGIENLPVKDKNKTKKNYKDKELNFLD